MPRPTTPLKVGSAHRKYGGPRYLLMWTISGLPERFAWNHERHIHA